jgi:hypothetical protein
VDISVVVLGVIDIAAELCSKPAITVIFTGVARPGSPRGERKYGGFPEYSFVQGGLQYRVGCQGLVQSGDYLQARG